MTKTVAVTIANICVARRWRGSSKNIIARPRYQVTTTSWPTGGASPCPIGGRRDRDDRTNRRQKHRHRRGTRRPNRRRHPPAAGREAQSHRGRAELTHPTRRTAASAPGSVAPVAQRDLGSVASAVSRTTRASARTKMGAWTASPERGEVRSMEPSRAASAEFRFTAGSRADREGLAIGDRGQ